MELKREKTVAYFAAAALFIVGIFCYAAFPVEEPEEPVRIMLKSTGGNVLFSHQEHTSEEGYGYACVDCHHLYEEEEGSKPEACGECHLADSEEEPKRSDAFHQQCIGCHEDNGGGPMECSQCHVL